jgi:CheY-like chemotaxis protein
MPEMSAVGAHADHRDFITDNDIDIRHWDGLKNSRILVVDDEPVNIRVIQNYLKIFGVTVLVAYSGMEALDLVKQNPDLVLLDVMMPRLNGYETARKIRESHPGDDLPIIFLTAKNQINDFVDGFSAGRQRLYHQTVFERRASHQNVVHINFKNAIFNRRHMLLIEQELDVARRIQYSSIPQHIPDFPGSGLRQSICRCSVSGAIFTIFTPTSKHTSGSLYPTCRDTAYRPL